MAKPENHKSSYTKEDLVLCGDGGLFGDDTGKLPADNMLMIDRIIEINSDGGSKGKGLVTAELDIRPDLWFFDCHFHGDPVMPGCLGLDALWQLCGFFLSWSGCKGKGRAKKRTRPDARSSAGPAKKVTYSLDIKRLIARKLSMVIANGKVAVDGRVIYTADDLRVGLFLSTDSF